MKYFFLDLLTLINKSLSMINISFKNPYLVIVFALIVGVISLVSLNKMAVDILPQFKTSAVQVLTLYPGMPAEVIEKDITSRIERWTGQSEGIVRQESKSIIDAEKNFLNESSKSIPFLTLIALM